MRKPRATVEEMKRAIRAAREEGLTVAEVILGANGEIRVIAEGALSGEDRDLAKFRERHGYT